MASRRWSDRWTSENAPTFFSDEVQFSSWVSSFLVEGAIRKVWEVDKKFVRPSNDIVLGRDGGAYCLRPI
jgi:hypothetical protein